MTPRNMKRIIWGKVVSLWNGIGKRQTNVTNGNRILVGKSTNYAMVVLVLGTIGFCIWVMKSSNSESIGDQQGRVSLLFIDENLTNNQNKWQLQRFEQDTVRFIHNILGEYSTILQEEEEGKLAKFICQECGKRGLDPLLLVAMIHVESTFQNFSESSMGAKGLMQILPSVGRSVAEEAEIPWEGNQTLLNPRENIRIGASYLKQLIEQFNDLQLALAAYNVGPTALKNHLRSGRPVSSLYAEKVMTFYQDLQKRSRRDTG